jgi:hypothetical protein
MKSQAETAARIFRAVPPALEKGSFIPDVELFLPEGRRQLLSQFRGRSNLVIVFIADNERIRALLADLAAQAKEIKNNEGKVLVIGAVKQLSADQPSTFATAVVPKLPEMLVGAQVIITDRFGEIFVAFPRANKPSVPVADEVLRWLEFINQQCEECSPPEWQE